MFSKKYNQALRQDSFLMANTRAFNAQINSRKRKKPNNHNPLAGLTFSDFGISAPQASTSSSALIRSESLSEDRRRVSRTELSVAIPSGLGKTSSSSTKAPELVVEPLHYHEDELVSEKRKERIERVGRNKSVCDFNSDYVFKS